MPIFNSKKPELSQSNDSSPSLQKPGMNKETTKQLPAPALKWGITPSKEPAKSKPDESSFSAEERAERDKLRAKGIDPDLKAEMDEKVYRNKSGGFWNKVAGTAFGGGTIK